MDKYKEELNDIHAPEALIMKTLAKVHEEEKKVEEEKKTAYEKKTEVNTIDTAVKEDTSNEETTGKVKKVNFIQKYRKFVLTASSLAAAAIILIIALNMNSMHGNNSTMQSDAPSSQSATEAVAEDSDMADSSYEDSKAETAVAESAETTETENAIDIKTESKTVRAEEYIDATESPENNATYSLGTESGMSLNADTAGAFRTLSIADYSVRIGLDLNKIIDRMNVEDEIVNISTDSDDQEHDLCSIKLAEESGNAEILISKSDPIRPQELLNGTPSYISGREVYIGGNSEGGKSCAYFEISGVGFLLQTSGISRDEFNTHLNELIRCFE
ncbi:MAG: hypothetical protein IKS48_03715 [Eubacterium sp.]|nr:hypothetical protein [Eubacterium sp.]